VRILTLHHIGSNHAADKNKNKMPSLNISLIEENHSTIAVVRGITADKLVAGRVGETNDGFEQISELEYGKMMVRVWWTLRGQPDSLGRAIARTWADRDQATHIELAHDVGRVEGAHKSVDAVRYEVRNSSLKL
jgi:hypothetical protein